MPLPSGLIERIAAAWNAAHAEDIAHPSEAHRVAHEFLRMLEAVSGRSMEDDPDESPPIVADEPPIAPDAAPDAQIPVSSGGSSDTSSSSELSPPVSSGGSASSGGTTTEF